MSILRSCANLRASGVAKTRPPEAAFAGAGADADGAGGGGGGGALLGGAGA